jgi:hypothetical protein
LNDPEFAAIPEFLACPGSAHAVPWRGLLLSGFGHLVFLLLPLLAALQIARSPRPSTPRRSSVQVFLPKQLLPQERHLNRNISFQDAAIHPPLSALAPPAKVAVDMSSIEISFAEDVANQLPEVIRKQRGVLALVDKTDSNIAHYLFEPPQWVFRSEIVDISDKVRFAMYPPEKWAVVSALAAEHGLQLDQFEVCALFETDYTSCLRDAIGVRAAGDPKGAGARVKAARLAFAAASPCGIDVLEVSFAVNH